MQALGNAHCVQLFEKAVLELREAAAGDCAMLGAAVPGLRSQCVVYRTAREDMLLEAIETMSTFVPTTPGDDDY